MKKYVFILICLITLSSCKKFLDIQPESDISKEELFSTEEGFKEAFKIEAFRKLCFSTFLIYNENHQYTIT